MAIISILLTALIIIVSILLVLIVLVQRPKQEGLGAAFGGGALDSALGAHTTDVLQKITTYLAVAFFVSAIGLAMVKSRQFSASPANNVLEKVEKRDALTPSMPPELSNMIEELKAGDTAPAPLTENPNSLLPPVGESVPTETPAPAPDAAETAPAPAEGSDKGKGNE